MIYVMSDLHGCYDKYVDMFEKIRFGEQDQLYILGDIVDRGEDGISILKDLMMRSNVIALRGNHDQDAMVYLRAFGMPGDGYGADELLLPFQRWLMDGGTCTYEKFLELPEDERERILRFLGSLGIHKELKVNGRVYFLSHTVPAKTKMLDFKNCSMNDFLKPIPEYNKVYFEDKILVTGHMPTGLIDKKSCGRIWKKNNHIAIDCGAVFGSPLGCLCLDTMGEYYVEEKKIYRYGRKP